jgi:Ca2+-binding EF-hand superfamily protein
MAYPSYPVFPAAPGGYPAPQPTAYPGYPSYPSQPSAPQPGYPAYPGYPGAGGPAGMPQPQPLENLPVDYQTSVSFLQESHQENLSDDGRRAFYNLAGADGEIDAFELQDILNKVFQRVFKFDGFSTDVTRSMVAMRDYDMSGKLDFEDFKLLWSDLSICKKAFQELDTDNSGYFDRSEFAQAFKIMGLHVSDQTQRAMTMRYSDKNGHVRFNDFVACYMRLKTMLKTFLTKDYYQQGNVEFEIDEYVQMCMYS